MLLLCCAVLAAAVDAWTDSMLRPALPGEHDRSFHCSDPSQVGRCSAQHERINQPT